MLALTLLGSLGCGKSKTDLPHEKGIRWQCVGQVSDKDGNFISDFPNQQVSVPKCANPDVDQGLLLKACKENCEEGFKQYGLTIGIGEKSFLTLKTPICAITGVAPSGDGCPSGSIVSLGGGPASGNMLVGGAETVTFACCGSAPGTIAGRVEYRIDACTTDPCPMRFSRIDLTSTGFLITNGDTVNIGDIRASNAGVPTFPRFADGTYQIPAHGLPITFNLKVDGAPASLTIDNSTPITGKAFSDSFTMDPLTLTGPDVSVAFGLNGASVNRPPVAKFTPGSGSIPCNTKSGATLTADASQTTDSESNIMKYVWYVNGKRKGEGVQIPVKLPLGLNSVQLEVFDAYVTAGVEKHALVVTGDGDGDGVCDLFDNCVGVPNPGQENCNLEAEMARGVTPKGDACDPSACGRGQTVPTPLTVSFAKQPECQPGLKVSNTQCLVTVDTGIVWQGIAGPPTGGKTGDVEMAHCPCSDEHATIEKRLTFCQVDPVFATVRCPLGDAQTFPTKSGPVKPSKWRASTTTLEEPQPGPFAEANHPYPTEFKLLNGPVHGPILWRFDLDLAKFGIPAPAPASVAVPEDLTPVAVKLDGIGWTATRKLAGAPLGGLFADLSNHYFAQDLNAGVDAKLLKELASVNDVVSHGNWMTPCAVPTPPCPIPDPAAVSYPWIIAKSPTEIIAVQNGRASSLGGLAAPPLASLLAAAGDTVDLVMASEPASLLLAAEADMRATAIDRATGFPSQLLAATPTGLSVVPLGGRCPPLVCDIGAASVSARAMSARNRELYVVRQEDVGLPERLTVFDLDTGLGETVDLTGAPAAATPIALTYRAADDSLYLLDEVVGTKHHAHDRFVRLMRLSRSGQAVEIGRARRHGLASALFLTTTYDGLLALSANGPGTAPVFFMFLVDPSGGSAKVVAWHVSARGALVLPPDTLGPAMYAVATSRPGKPGIAFGEIPRADFKVVPDKSKGPGLPDPL